MVRFAILLVMVAAVPCAGQTDTVPHAPSPMRICWRGKPMPECRSFWITEVSGEYAFASTTTRYDQYYNGNLEFSLHERDVSSRVAWTIGPMFNITPTRTLGGTLSVGVTNAGSRIAMEARRRDWYSGGTVDFSAGLVRTDMPFAYRRSNDYGYGLTAGAYFGGGDLIHLTAHGDLLFAGGKVRGGTTIGGGLGSYPAAGATVLFLALGILVIAAIANCGDC